MDKTLSASFPFVKKSVYKGWNLPVKPFFIPLTVILIVSGDVIKWTGRLLSMRKIGNIYIVPKEEMDTINWFLKLLDRHREQDKKRQEEQGHEEDIKSDL